MNQHKATARAPANIAFIKYWGKTDSWTRVPANNSVSMCLSEFHTLCTVEISEQFAEDMVSFRGEAVVAGGELERITQVLARVRKLTGQSLFARVATRNNFPKATGIASSASGFAALSAAAVEVYGAKLNQRELSVFARQASGTACRSVPDGFVEWLSDDGAGESYAVSVHSPDWWNICDVVAIVTKKMKKVSSTEGHALAQTSPFYQARLLGMPAKVMALKQALAQKDFSHFGALLEAEALNMHAICLTSTPAVVYWEAPTMSMIRSIVEWRERGAVESYFTIDAGPTVHAICRAEDSGELAQRLAAIAGVREVVVNKPGLGVRLVDRHLF